jgi:hypothetical protein
MITPSQIKKLIEIKAEIEDIGIKSRANNLPVYRAIAYYILKKSNPLLTYAEIALEFNVDHATVMHGIKLFKNILDTPTQSKNYIEFYKECMSEIKNNNKNKNIFNIVVQNNRLSEQNFELQSKVYDLNKLLFEYENIINNFNLRPVFNEISQLDQESLDEFEIRANAFLQMKRIKEKNVYLMQNI